MDTSQMVSEWMADNRNGMAWDYLTNEEQLMALLVMEAPEEEPSVVDWDDVRDGRREGRDETI